MSRTGLSRFTTCGLILIVVIGLSDPTFALTSRVIFVSPVYDCDTTVPQNWHLGTWVNSTGSTLVIKKIMLWQGMDSGGVGDLAMNLHRVTTGEQLLLSIQTVYVQPVPEVYQDFPDGFLVSDGETLGITYGCHTVNPQHGQALVTIWTLP